MAKITRRTFLKQGTSAALGAGFYFHSSAIAGREPEAKSRVVLIRRNDLLNNSGNVQSDIMDAMVDEALCTLFDLTDPAEAWQRIVSRDDIVGIKSNESRPSTPVELERAVRNRVIKAGVSQKNVSINDRGVRGDKIFQKSTALINMRPMKTHHWSGVGSLIKNYIMFVPQPWMYHDDACADLAAIWRLPLVKGKTRLNILVMIEPLFHGIGPHHYNLKYTWRYNGLVVGQDPVAVDSVGLRIIIAKRRDYFQEEKPLVPSAKHIQYGQTRHGIGIADSDRIELIRLGEKEGALI